VSDRLRTRRAAFLLAAGIVVLSLASSYIHFTLGNTATLLGLLFLANAAGYVTLAGAVVAVATVRHPLVQRFGWAPRVALAGFAALTIAGYLVMGPYFALGWITKAIEVALIALLVLDMIRVYGSPRGVVRSALASLRGSSDAATARA
jgi:hypothetical protein